MIPSHIRITGNKAENDLIKRAPNYLKPLITNEIYIVLVPCHKNLTNMTACNLGEYKYIDESKLSCCKMCRC